MPKKKRGAGWSKGHDDRKHGNKDTKYEDRKVAEWQAKLDAKHGRSGTSGTSPQSAQTSRTRAATADDDESDESEDTASAAEKRVTIKYFYVTECHCAPEEDWSGRDGTIAYIRHRMGSSAPSIHVVRNCLGHGPHVGASPNECTNRRRHDTAAARAG